MAHKKRTPAGFVQAVVTIKMASEPLALFYRPQTRECLTGFTDRRRPQRTVKVGIYGPGGGKELVAAMRLDLEEVIERAERR